MPNGASKLCLWDAKLFIILDIVVWIGLKFGVLCWKFFCLVFVYVNLILRRKKKTKSVFPGIRCAQPGMHL